MSSPTTRRRHTPGTGDKVTQEQFTPRSLRVANLGKSVVREHIALESAFPPKKDHFLWESIQIAAKSLKQEEVLARTMADIELKEKLIRYVHCLVHVLYLPFYIACFQAGYGINGIRGNLKDKMKGKIGGHYGIPGKLSVGEIQETVAWLLQKGNFTCAGINVKV